MINRVGYVSTTRAGDQTETCVFMARRANHFPAAALHAVTTKKLSTHSSVFPLKSWRSVAAGGSHAGLWVLSLCGQSEGEQEQVLTTDEDNTPREASLHSLVASIPEGPPNKLPRSHPSPPQDTPGRLTSTMSYVGVPSSPTETTLWAGSTPGRRDTCPHSRS